MLIELNLGHSQDLCGHILVKLLILMKGHDRGVLLAVDTLLCHRHIIRWLLFLGLLKLINVFYYHLLMFLCLLALK